MAAWPLDSTSGSIKSQERIFCFPYVILSVPSPPSALHPAGRSRSPQARGAPGSGPIPIQGLEAPVCGSSCEGTKGRSSCPGLQGGHGEAGPDWLSLPQPLVSTWPRSTLRSLCCQPRLTLLGAPCSPPSLRSPETGPAPPSARTMTGTSPAQGHPSKLRLGS